MAIAQVGAGSQDFAGATSISCYFAGHVWTSGNHIIIAMFEYQGTPPATPFAQFGGAGSMGTPVRDVVLAGGSGLNGIAIYHIPITGSGEIQLTYTGSGGNPCGYAAGEFSGLDVSSLGQSNTGTGSNAHTSPFETTGSIENTPGNLIVQAVSELSGSGGTARTFSDTALGNLADGLNNYTLGLQYKITSATPNTLYADYNENVNWFTAFVEYKAAGGGAVTVTPPVGAVSMSGIAFKMDKGIYVPTEINA